MQDRYRLIRRGNRYYAVDRNDLSRESLGTDSLRNAKRLVAAKNEASQQSNLNIALGRTYLSAHDPNMAGRTWQTVMDVFCKRGKEKTWVRRERAMRTAACAGLKAKRLVETTGDDLRHALTLGGSSTNHFLRCLHNLALGLGWIAFPVLAPRALAQAKLQAQARHYAGGTSPHSSRRKESGTQSLLPVVVGSGRLSERRRDVERRQH